jgi:hypothetical protein
MTYSRARKSFKFHHKFEVWRTDYFYFLRIGHNQFDWPRLKMWMRRKPRARARR